MAKNKVSQHQLKKRKKLNINALPDELLVSILSFLSASDLCKCAQVYFRFARIAGDHYIWTERLSDNFNLDKNYCKSLFDCRKVYRTLYILKHHEKQHLREYYKKLYTRIFQQQAPYPPIHFHKHITKPNLQGVSESFIRTWIQDAALFGNTDCIAWLTEEIDANITPDSCTFNNALITNNIDTYQWLIRNFSLDAFEFDGNNVMFAGLDLLVLLQQNYNHLKAISLRNIEFHSNRIFFENINCDIITTLTLDNVDIEYLSGGRKMLRRIFATFPNLINLTIKNCNQLREINLLAVNLTSIVLENNPRLQAIRIHYQNLDNLTIIQCPQLNILKLNAPIQFCTLNRCSRNFDTFLKYINRQAHSIILIDDNNVQSFYQAKHMLASTQLFKPLCYSADDVQPLGPHMTFTLIGGYVKTQLYQQIRDEVYPVRQVELPLCQESAFKTLVIRNQKYSIRLWSAAEQLQQSCFTQHLLSNSHAALIIADLENDNGLMEIKQRMKLLKLTCPIILVGCYGRCQSRENYFDANPLFELVKKVKVHMFILCDIRSEASVKNVLIKTAKAIINHNVNPEILSEFPILFERYSALYRNPKVVILSDSNNAYTHSAYNSASKNAFLGVNTHAAENQEALSIASQQTTIRMLSELNTVSTSTANTTENTVQTTSSNYPDIQISQVDYSQTSNSDTDSSDYSSSTTIGR